MLTRLFACNVGTLLVAACLPVVAQAQPQMQTQAPTSGVAWRTNLDQAKMEAAQSGRLLLIHFTTKSCGPCRVLDQNVFSQPHVGPAIEQNYIPVRVDADASPALAAMYRIDRVPTEIVATAEGQQLANPPIPDKVDAYLAQLQNMAQHFRQSAAGAAQTDASANVNSAYAGLSAAQSPAGPQVIRNPAMQQQQQQQSQPQTQGNPYVNAATNPNVYGQAQNVYAAPPQQAAPAQAASQSPQQGSYQQQVAAQTPAMPSNAMPRSYRNPATDATVAAIAAVPGATAITSAAAGAETARLAATPQLEKPQLPAGAPPLAFDGFCPVTLKTLNRWSMGDSQFGLVHRGRTYLFTGAEQRDQFYANPDGFSPVFGGLDPVMLIDKQQSVEGSRIVGGFRYGDSFYLFSNEESKQKFAASPHTYAAGVRQAMNRIDSAGTVRR
ncbi:MAG: thioredoxin family protein [Pirellulales bacterium]|nr:thioredoxin family protein [Pirellulales bacterium]